MHTPPQVLHLADASEAVCSAAAAAPAPAAPAAAAPAAAAPAAAAGDASGRLLSTTAASAADDEGEAALSRLLASTDALAATLVPPLAASARAALSALHASGVSFDAEGRVAEIDPPALSASLTALAPQLAAFGAAVSERMSEGGAALCADVQPSTAWNRAAWHVYTSPHGDANTGTPPRDEPRPRAVRRRRRRALRSRAADDDVCVRAGPFAAAAALARRRRAHVGRRVGV